MEDKEEALLRVELLDPSVGWKKVIRSRGFRSVCMGITEKCFPLPKRTVDWVDIHLKYYDFSKSVEEILDELQSAGLQPVDLLQFISLDAAYPHLRKDCPLVAIGCKWVNPKEKTFFPYITEKGGDAFFDLEQAVEWMSPGAHCFPAVSIGS